MRKKAALIQIILVLLVVVYSTYHLFRGNFELALSTLPFLMCYYVFVTARHRKAQLRKDDDEFE